MNESIHLFYRLFVSHVFFFNFNLTKSFDKKRDRTNEDDFNAIFNLPISLISDLQPDGRPLNFYLVIKINLHFFFMLEMFVLLSFWLLLPCCFDRLNINAFKHDLIQFVYKQKNKNKFNNINNQKGSNIERWYDRQTRVKY